MKATQQQRLTLALQAAENIVPVQFQLECHYFSLAVRPWRIIASAVVFMAVVGLLSLSLNVFYAVLIALSATYGFFQSFLSVAVWPASFLHEKIRQWHNSQPTQIEGVAKVVIRASQHPSDLRIDTSSDLATVKGFDQISATSAALITRENVLEAMLHSVEACALAILPVAASLPKRIADSSLRVIR